MKVYKEKYVEFALTAVRKNFRRNPLILSPQKSSSTAKKRHSKVVSGILFESGGWSSDEDNVQGKTVTLEEYYEEEASRVFRN